MGHSFVKFVVWLFVVSVGFEGNVVGRATCESTGLGQPAHVTCHYSENLVEARDVSAVSLLRDKGGKREKVVECDRFLNYGFDCHPKAGYKLNGTVSDQMIINIPRARPEDQGTYYCELRIQQTEFQMESCDLDYKEPNDATTSTPPADATTSTPPSEQDSNDQLKGDTGTSNASAWLIAITALILVLLVIAVLVFAVLFVCWRHRRRPYREDVPLEPMNCVIGDGDCPRPVGQLSENFTEDDDTLDDLSKGDYDDHGMTAKPFINAFHSAAENKLICTDDNSQRWGNMRVCVTYPNCTSLGLHCSRCACAKPIIDIDTQSCTDSLWPTKARGPLFTGNSQGNGHNDNLKEKGLFEGTVLS